MNLNCIRILLLLLVVQVVATDLWAQSEGDNWVFGTQAWMDFRQGSANVNTGAAINTQEGSASISDGEGNLLFYTDGLTLFNHRHQAMPNGSGLLGNNGSTQAALIVPHPGDSNLYYVFTTDEFADSLGARYNIVDMREDRCLGDVTLKNEKLYPRTAEKAIAIPHANGNDWWVVMHGFNTDSFLVYEITSAGLNTVPVVSQVGHVYIPVMMNNGNVIGQMSATLDGTRLAVVINNIHRIELFDFDPATGLITNPITVKTDALPGPQALFPYGVEFSPNGNLMYCNGFLNYVFQFDLSSGTAAGIEASAVMITNNGSAQKRSFELAPDGKIYVAKVASVWIAAIERPNEPGLACQYVDSAVFLNGTCWAGLPNVLTSQYDYGNFTYLFPCDSTFSHFIAGDTSGIDSLRWNFGDPGSGAMNTSTFPVAFHQFPSAGEYTVTLTMWTAGVPDSSVRNVHIRPQPVIELGNDTLLCPGVPLDLQVPDGMRVEWSDGSACSDFTVDSTGTYYVEVENICGSATDTITVTYLPAPPLDLGNDTNVCQADSFVIDAGNTGVGFVWQNGSTNQTFTATSTGTYTVTVTDAATCEHVDSIRVTFAGDYAITPSNDTTLCVGDTLVIDAGSGWSNYAWSNGPTTQMIDATITDQYIVTVTDTSNCSSTDTISVQFNSVSVTLGNDTTICTGESFTLNANNPGLNFLWQDASTSATFLVDQAGTFGVRVSDAIGCSDTATIVVTTSDITVFPSNDTTICTGDSAQLSAGVIATTYAWSDGTPTANLTTGTAGTYSVTVTNFNGCTDSGSVTVSLSSVNVTLPPDTVLCGVFSYDISLPQPPSTSYAWTDGSSGPTFNVTTYGTIAVMATNLFGCADSDTTVVSEFCEAEVTIPNVFSPNGDDLNELFLPVANNIASSELVVVNRWGIELYRSNQLNAGWDGKYEGQDVPDGIYYYIFSYRDKLDQESVLKGTVSLMR